MFAGENSIDVSVGDIFGEIFNGGVDFEVDVLDGEELFLGDFTREVVGVDDGDHFGALETLLGMGVGTAHGGL